MKKIVPKGTLKSILAKKTHIFGSHVVDYKMSIAKASTLQG